MNFKKEKLLQIRNSAWKDPVWSKIIATGIIAVLMAAYSFFAKLTDNIDFTESFKSILTSR